MEGKLDRLLFWVTGEGGKKVSPKKLAKLEKNWLGTSTKEERDG